MLSAESGAFTTETPARFVLPPELEAREPAEARGAGRDDVRLLVTDGVQGAIHSRFERLPDFLEPGDLVVMNDSRTFPAALHATRENGEQFSLNVAVRPAGRERPNASSGALRWTVLVEARNAVLSAGERLSLPGGGLAVVVGPHAESRRMWNARFALPLAFYTYFERFGKPIAYRHVTREWPIDTYQTVYASAIGSSEMPSAGRPFTPASNARLKARGVGVAMLTLHAGVSSFERDEPPLDEWREVPVATAEAVSRARSQGRRVIAVGTTVVRALASSVDVRGLIEPSRGWTNLIITRDQALQVVDGLLTGFHEPASSHLAILESIAGHKHVQDAYASALDHKYLWHEFGDSHLLLAGRV